MKGRSVRGASAAADVVHTEAPASGVQGCYRKGGGRHHTSHDQPPAGGVDLKDATVPSTSNAASRDVEPAIATTPQDAWSVCGKQLLPYAHKSRLLQAARGPIKSQAQGAALAADTDSEQQADQGPGDEVAQHSRSRCQAADGADLLAALDAAAKAAVATAWDARRCLRTGMCGFLALQQHVRQQQRLAHRTAQKHQYRQLVACFAAWQQRTQGSRRRTAALLHLQLRRLQALQRRAWQAWCMHMQQQAVRQRQLLKAYHYRAFMMQLQALQHWHRHVQQRGAKQAQQDRLCVEVEQHAQAHYLQVWAAAAAEAHATRQEQEAAVRHWQRWVLSLHLTRWRARTHQMQQARAAAAAQLVRVQQAAWRHQVSAMLRGWRSAAQRLKQLRSISGQVAARWHRFRLQQVMAAWRQHLAHRRALAAAAACLQPLQQRLHVVATWQRWRQRVESGQAADAAALRRLVVLRAVLGTWLMAVDVHKSSTERLAAAQAQLRRQRLRRLVIAWRVRAQHQLAQHQQLQQLQASRRQRLLRLLLGVWKRRCQAWAARKVQQQVAEQHRAVRLLRRSLALWRKHFRRQAAKQLVPQLATHCLLQRCFAAWRQHAAYKGWMQLQRRRAIRYRYLRLMLLSMEVWGWWLQQRRRKRLMLAVAEAARRQLLQRRALQFWAAQWLPAKRQARQQLAMAQRHYQQHLLTAGLVALTASTAAAAAAQQREQELLHQARIAALRRVAAAWLGLAQQRQAALAEQYAWAAAHHTRSLQQRLPLLVQGWRHVAHLQQWQRQQVQLLKQGCLHRRKRHALLAWRCWLHQQQQGAAAEVAAAEHWRRRQLWRCMVHWRERCGSRVRAAAKAGRAAAHWRLQLLRSGWKSWRFMFIVARALRHPVAGPAAVTLHLPTAAAAAAAASAAGEVCQPPPPASVASKPASPPTRCTTASAPEHQLLCTEQLEYMDGDTAAPRIKGSSVMAWSSTCLAQPQQQQEAASWPSARQPLPVPRSYPSWGGSTGSMDQPSSTPIGGTAAEAAATDCTMRRRKRWLDLPVGLGDSSWPGAAGAAALPAAVQASALQLAGVQLQQAVAGTASEGGCCQQAREGTRPTPNVRHRAAVTTTGPPVTAVNSGCAAGSTSASHQARGLGGPGPASGTAAHGTKEEWVSAATRGAAAVQLVAVIGQQQQQQLVHGSPMVGHWPTPNPRPRPRPLPVLDLPGASSSSSQLQEIAPMQQQQHASSVAGAVSGLVPTGPGRWTGAGRAHVSTAVGQEQMHAAETLRNLQHADGLAAAAAVADGCKDGTSNVASSSMLSAVISTAQHGQEQQPCRSSRLHCRPAPKVPSFLLDSLNVQHTATV